MAEGVVAAVMVAAQGGVVAQGGAAAPVGSLPPVTHRAAVVQRERRCLYLARQEPSRLLQQPTGQAEGKPPLFHKESHLLVALSAAGPEVKFTVLCE